MKIKPIIAIDVDGVINRLARIEHLHGFAWPHMLIHVDPLTGLQDHHMDIAKGWLKELS